MKMPKAEVKEVNIYYKVHGQGEPLLLIMGLTGIQRAWVFQIRAFKKYYQVITFDNRGRGKTGKPSEPYTIKMMAEDTVGLMDYLKVDKAHILGISLGGMIAQEMAINYPERVRKLILASTTAGGGGISDTPSELRRAMGLKDSFSEANVRGVDFRSMDFEKVMRAIVSLSFNKRLFRMVFVPLSKIHVKRIGLGNFMTQFEASRTHNTLDRLHLIEVPTLVITGTEDRLVPPRSSEALASRIPHARLVKIEGGSHSLFMEMRGRFNKEVLDFLRTN
jgi:pimeloyl-ACP methyl ester carboxylesterase